MSKVPIIYGAMVCGCLFTGMQAQSSQSGNYSKERAEKILQTAEEIRSLEKAEILVDLTTQNGKQKTAFAMKILRSTGRRAYIDFLGPKEERGRRMLARGQNYWSTFPDSKRVEVSRMEIIGNSAFAFADIFQLDAERDYDAEIIATEDYSGKSAFKLQLKAKSDEAPYDKIEYWVEEETSFPLKAAFYGSSGKLLKTMTVEARKVLGGRLRPEITKMVDEVTADHVSWWKTKSMKSAEIPDQVFLKDFLKNG